MVMCSPQVQRFHRRIRGHSMTIRYWPEALTDISRLPTSKTCRDLVYQAQAVALAELGSPLNISELCEVLAVSVCTLRKAFHNIQCHQPLIPILNTRCSDAW